MNNYLLILHDGTRHDNLTLDDVRRILIDDCHYSYARVKGMLDKVVHRNEVAQWLLRADKLCERAEATIKEIREVSRKMDEEFKQWFLSKKSTSAANADIVVESARPSLPKANTVVESKPERQP